MTAADQIRQSLVPLRDHEAITALAALEAELAEAKREASRAVHLVECADTPLMRDVMAERDALRADLAATTEALRRIRENGLAWHGPEPPGSGHVRALTVIAEWADEALAALSPGTEETP